MEFGEVFALLAGLVGILWLYVKAYPLGEDHAAGARIRPAPRPRAVFHAPARDAPELRRAKSDSGDKTIRLQHLLSACVDVSERAGAEIRSVMQSGNFGIQMKQFENETEILTRADTRAEYIIEATLCHEFPSLRIIGEEVVEGLEVADTNIEAPNLDRLPDFVSSKFPEALREVDTDDVTLWVDPLDATGEYVKGNTDAVIVNIGICIGRTPVAGVMHQPFADGGKGRTIWGVVGVGAYGFERVKRENFDELVAVTSGRKIEAITDACNAIFADKIIRIGGAAFKFVKVLEGEADVYILPLRTTKKWDSCAPDAILRAAGGYVTDCNGCDIDYSYDSPVVNLDGVVASYREHEQIIHRLQTAKAAGKKKKISSEAAKQESKVDGEAKNESKS